MKIALTTLGCKVNMYETEAMGELFVKSGYELVDFEQEADIYIVNTCSVTNFGDKKSRQMLRRAKKQNPNAVVVAVGCYAQVASDELERLEDIRKGRLTFLEPYQFLDTALNNILHIFNF